TGGGAVLDPSIWDIDLLGHDDCLVVWLDAPPDALVARLTLQAQREGNKADRPLLEGDPLARITAMRDARTPHYAKADVVLDVSQVDASTIARDVAELVTLATGG